MLSVIVRVAPRRRMLREADSMVTRARMFEHKPDGDVNIFMLQVRPNPYSKPYCRCAPRARQGQRGGRRWSPSMGGPTLGASVMRE